MFAEVLKRYRSEQELSLQKVADKCDVEITASYVHRLETADKKNPTFKVCVSLCRALDMDLREVFQAFDVEDVFDKAVIREINKKFAINIDEITNDRIVKKYLYEILKEVYLTLVIGDMDHEDSMIRLSNFIEKLMLARKEIKKKQCG